MNGEINSVDSIDILADSGRKRSMRRAVTNPERQVPAFAAEELSEKSDPHYTFSGKKGSYFQRNFAKRMPKTGNSPAKPSSPIKTKTEPIKSPSINKIEMKEKNKSSLDNIQELNKSKQTNNEDENTSLLVPKNNYDDSEDADADVEDNVDPKLTKMLEEKRNRKRRTKKMTDSNSVFESIPEIEPPKPAYSSGPPGQIKSIEDTTQKVSFDKPEKRNQEEIKQQISSPIASKPVPTPSLNATNEVPISLKETQRSPKQESISLMEPDLPTSPPKPPHVNLKHIPTSRSDNLDKTEAQSVKLQRPIPRIPMPRSRLEPKRTVNNLPLTNQAPLIPDKTQDMRQEGSYPEILIQPATSRPKSTIAERHQSVHMAHTSVDIGAVPIALNSIDSFFSAAAFSVSELFAPERPDVHAIRDGIDHMTNRSRTVTETISHLSDKVGDLENTISDGHYGATKVTSSINAVTQRAKMARDKMSVLKDKMENSSGGASMKVVLLQLLIRIAAVVYFIVMLVVNGVLSVFGRKKRAPSLLEAEARMRAAQERIQNAQALEESEAGD